MKGAQSANGTCFAETRGGEKKKRDEAGKAGATDR